MPKNALISLVKATKLLVEVGISLFEGFDARTILDELNELADDLEVSLSTYCKASGENNALTIDATPESLYETFGWKIKRVRARNWNYKTRQFENVCDSLYVWEEINKPTKFPVCLEGKVKEISLDQPATNDNGEQNYP